jgi:hypothetical protein
MVVQSGLGAELAEIERLFKEAIARSPDDVGAHRQMFSASCAKWQGSHLEMFAFARQAASNAAPGSPQHALVAHAHIEYWMSMYWGEPSEDADDYPRQPHVVNELLKAFDAFVAEDPREAVHHRDAWNAFALMMDQVEDAERAGRCFDVLKGRYTRWPWAYLGHPREEFEGAESRAEGIQAQK